MPATDVITDTLERLAERRKIPDKVLREVEADLRADWGGERTYIPKVGETGRAQLTERDRRIRADFRRGEREPLLARRHGISVRRVRQILQASGDLPGPTGNALP